MAVRFQTAATNYQTRASDLLSYNAAYTWMAWCKLIASTGGGGLVFVIRNGDGLQSDYVLTGTGGTGVGAAINAGVDGTGDLTEWNVGDTHHFALVRASSTDLKLYKNGAQIGPTVVTDVGTSRTLSGMDSGSALGSGNRWDGHKFGEKAWSAALTAAEIVNEMRTMRPQRTTNLYAWWPGIDASAANAAIDYSGNGRSWTNNGTIAVEDGGAGVSWGGSPIYLPFVAVSSAPTLSAPGLNSITTTTAIPKVTLTI